MNGRKILVVDDERIVAQDIIEVLQNMGCQVVGTALSGLDAISKSESLNPDLVLMDITLQGEMDGVEAATIIRERWDIPSVFLTAYSDSNVLNRAKRCTPAGYIVKPFEEAGLRSTVEIALYKVDLERALRESNEWLRATLTSISNGVLATNERGQIQFLNAQAEHMIGQTGESAFGRLEEELFTLTNEFTGEAVENPSMGAMREGKIVSVPEGALMHKADGTVLPIETTGVPIRNNKGAIIGSVMVMVDVTDRRTAEREVRRHQEHLEELVQERTAELTLINQRMVEEIEERKRAENMLEYRVAAERTISAISSSFLRTKSAELDAAVEQALGRIGQFLAADRCYLLRHSVDAKLVHCTHEWIGGGIMQLREHFQNVPSSALPLSAPVGENGHVFVISHNEGGPFASYQPEIAQARGARSVLFFQMRQGEEPFGFLCVDCVGQFRQWREEDAAFLGLVSDSLMSAIRRKASEEDRARLHSQLTQSQKMEAVGKLSGGIAHDFNNMLLPIIGYADMVLGREGVDEASRADLREIKRSAEQAASLTRQLLAFSRKQVIKKTVFDVNQALRSMSKMLRRIIGEDIEMNMDLMPDLLPVQADIGQLEQVILNFAVNARDAMPSGGSLWIKTRTVPAGTANFSLVNGQAPEGDYICISVKDTGCGIAPEIAERIFEPFFTTKGIEGTGLGLSVIYGIVQEHNGSIQLESKPGEGATFHVYLPGLHVAVPKSEEEGDLPVKTFKGFGQRVLLVEDEEAVNRLVRTALAQNGYTVTAADCVQDALAKFEQHQGQFDMVFTDAVLPDGNGVDLLGNLLTKNPNLRALLSSGYTDKHQLLNLAKQRQISFLAKPYSLPKLFQTVAEVMKDQASHVLV